jgi:hypothetical protein
MRQITRSVSTGDDHAVIAFRARGKYDLTRPDALPWRYGIAADVLRQSGRPGRIHRARGHHAVALRDTGRGGRDARGGRGHSRRDRGPDVVDTAGRRCVAVSRLAGGSRRELII